jgi:hypothetical protein
MHSALLDSSAFLRPADLYAAVRTAWNRRPYVREHGWGVSVNIPITEIEWRQVRLPLTAILLFVIFFLLLTSFLAHQVADDQAEAENAVLATVAQLCNIRIVVVTSSANFPFFVVNPSGGMGPEFVPRTVFLAEWDKAHFQLVQFDDLQAAWSNAVLFFENPEAHVALPVPPLGAVRFNLLRLPLGNKNTNFNGPASCPLPVLLFFKCFSP